MKRGPRPRYSLEDAQRMLEDRRSGMLLKQIAKKYGCSIFTAHTWIGRAARLDRQ